MHQDVFSYFCKMHQSVIQEETFLFKQKQHKLFNKKLDCLALMHKSVSGMTYINKPQI